MLERRESAEGPVYYVSPLLQRAGIRHAFSTRLGGVSPAPFDSLNLGNPGGCDRQDDDERIQANYRRLQAALGCVHSTRCWVHQVHGGDVADANSGFSNGIKADALLTNDPSQVLAIRIADCVPILVADEQGKTVAAIHAGWRGVIAGIIPATLARMPDMNSLIAAIGPCIGFDAFEVGHEVLREFDRAFGDEAPVRRNGNGKGHVDLRAACHLQLRRAGLSDEQIDTTDRCTFRDADEFFSHRRDRGVTGRLAALIAPRSR
ncbi:MAG TPA: peptidoglycan editing factor PgeF [Tepidisphaeraceae bacterium]|nr:peptidoglycan editing factor PgeF [Tepidisphaeraceae bacterium]